jgi:hypothetical protein
VISTYLHIIGTSAVQSVCQLCHIGAFSTSSKGSMRPFVEGNIFGLSRVNGHHSFSCCCVSLAGLRVFGFPPSGAPEVGAEPSAPAKFFVDLMFLLRYTDPDDGAAGDFRLCSRHALISSTV